MSAIIIQAAVKSMLTRIWLREWKRKRAYYIVRCQAHVRRRITYRRFLRWKRIEYACACKAQSIIRMYLARCKLFLMIKAKAADTISSAYRGFRGRKNYINRRQSHYAIKIQTRVRIYQSKQLYVKEKTQKDFAAKGIQRCWKGYLARKSISTILFDRFKHSCQNQLRMYDAEVEYLVSVLDNLTSSEALESDEEEKKELEHHKYEESILESEKKIQEIQKTLRQLTPRSVQQGWKEQIEKSLEIERSVLTQRKMQVLFQKRNNIRYNTEKLDILQGKRQECLKKIEVLQGWSNELTSMLHNEDKRIRHNEATRYGRQAVADEKRKWAIELMTASGKPLKPGPKIIDINPKSREHKLMDLLKMQLYLTNVSQMRKVIKPLNKVTTLW